MSELKDNLWNIISGNFCYGKIPSICPISEEGETVSYD